MTYNVSFSIDMDAFALRRPVMVTIAARDGESRDRESSSIRRSSNPAFFSSHHQPSPVSSQDKARSTTTTTAFQSIEDSFSFKQLSTITMKTSLLVVLSTIGLAVASPPPIHHCKVDGKIGQCMRTSVGCKDGSFHKGSPPHWPCPGGDDIQCCIKNHNGTAPPTSSQSQTHSGSSIVAPTASAFSGLASAGATIGIPAKSDSEAGSAAGGPIAGLNAAQSAHAWAIMGEVRAEGLPHQACLAAFATGLVESSLRILANNGVPASLKYPHDGLGSDHDSIGIFQQRASVYKDVAADMDAAGSARQFFAVMKGIPGWQTMDVGTLCQKVQRSAYPTRYGQQVGTATKICAAGGL